jgi:hypothetical protein
MCDADVVRSRIACVLAFAVAVRIREPGSKSIAAVFGPGDRPVRECEYPACTVEPIFQHTCRDLMSIRGCLRWLRGG